MSINEFSRWLLEEEPFTLLIFCLVFLIFGMRMRLMCIQATGMFRYEQKVLAVCLSFIIAMGAAALFHGCKEMF